MGGRDVVAGRDECNAMIEGEKDETVYSWRSDFEQTEGSALHSTCLLLRRAEDVLAGGNGGCFEVWMAFGVGGLMGGCRNWWEQVLGMGDECMF